MSINSVEEMALYLYKASPRYTKELHEGRKAMLSGKVEYFTNLSEAALQEGNLEAAADFTQLAATHLGCLRGEILILQDFA